MRFKLVNRVLAIGWSTVNTLSGAIFSMLLSVEVIRLCSKELWGSMVEILLWFGLASHMLYFGNRNLLLKEFSLMPQSISEHWGKSLQARFWLYLLACLLLFFIPLEFKLKLLLFTFLSANFLYKSYDVVILFKRQFIVSVLLEAVGFSLIAFYILLQRKDMTLNRLVMAFTIAEIGKTLSVYFFYINEIKLPVFKFNISYFSIALPFFLFEFTGLLLSKTDLICVTYFLSKEKIAQYQVYVNFLLLVQSAAGFILLPFAKNIYRMKSGSAKKLSYKFFGLGVLLAIVAIPLVNFFIVWFYHFTIPFLSLVAGAFFIPPIFYYSITIYQLIKSGRQNSIVLLNIIAIISGFILNIILIPRSSDGISGAIFAIAITQWMLLLIYFTIQKKMVFSLSK